MTYEAFVIELQNAPSYIYDSRSPQFKNHRLRLEGFAEMARKLDSIMFLQRDERTAKDVQAESKKLVREYRDEKRKGKLRSGAGAEESIHIVMASLGSTELSHTTHSRRLATILILIVALMEGVTKNSPPSIRAQGS